MSGCTCTQRCKMTASYGRKLVETMARPFARARAQRTMSSGVLWRNSAFQLVIGSGFIFGKSTTAVDPRQHASFGAGPAELSAYLPAFYEQESWNGRDAEFDRHIKIRRSVNLDYLQIRPLLRHLFQNRGHHSAGCAVVRVEIDQDCSSVVQDLRFERH